MASVFRRRIGYKIVSTILPLLNKDKVIHMADSIPVLLKLQQHKFLPPQFELTWKDILKVQPELQERVHPNTVLTYLKNQDFPTKDGISDIYMDSIKQDKFIFVVEQERFTSSVLLDICFRINVIPANSCFFRNVPVESILVEFSSPNIAKPFHYGHFRSTIIGNFVANICNYVGHEVTRMNYIGDWGFQYGILAAGFRKFGSEEKLSADPLTHLFEVYKEANARISNDKEFDEEARKYFQLMEEGDSEVLSLWSKLRDLSLKEMKATYHRLNINFDVFHGESMYAENVKEIFDELQKKNLVTCDENGCIEIVVPKQNGEQETVVLRKSDGTSLYLSRDIAAAIDRMKKYHFDSLYYVVDSSQTKHFTFLRNILTSMGYSWASNIHHIPFGRILKFSTRKGSVVFLHDILNEAKERTLESMKNSPNTKVEDDMDETADILGIASLIINDFSTKRRKDYNFTWERVLDIKGDSGNSLQYCHARLNSIKEKCGFDLCKDCELQSLVEPEAISLIAHLAKFDEVIYKTYADLEPCILVHYLFLLRNEIGRAIKVLPVKGSNPYVGRARLLLFHAAQLVLKKGLQILGITPLNQM
ncbi:probable arginine--tRNA ligase, mitochondrial isoform X2 [Stegodyphus dumicola]|uniref:probable arginine--tRNA ligase, mitochondrial isoform X2 n=1 Tax=Stegodyphus dumicola TaxID=202533 RepID=UPI0015AAC211|nr:probable arginine--tRNA ligase, mitochondrial isoform X2 [Stegodyphus dumicola]